MPKPQDLTGKKFGRLTVICAAKSIRTNGRLRRRWLCNCDCTNKKVIVLHDSLNGGKQQSCGCLKKEFNTYRFAHDLTGRVFDRLTVVSYDGRSDSGELMWKCLCKCTQITRVSTHALEQGNTRSCGCLAKEGNRTTHGNARVGRRTPEYRSWRAMMQRCNDPNQPQAANYINAGVVVCDRWKNFENFLADMGPKPTPKHSIGRFEDDGPYDPWNCAWQSSAEQGIEHSKKCAIRKTAPAVKGKTAK